MHQWGTVKATPHLDRVGCVEHRRNLLRIVTIDRDADYPHLSFGLTRTVNRDTTNGAKAIQ